MAVLVCIPTNSVRGFLFSTPSPAFIACGLLDCSHSDWREMVPHCGFDLHFSGNEWCWASFHVFVGHLFVFKDDIFFLISGFFIIEYSQTEIFLIVFSFGDSGWAFWTGILHGWHYRVLTASCKELPIFSFCHCEQCLVLSVSEMMWYIETM